MSELYEIINDKHPSSNSGNQLLLQNGLIVKKSDKNSLQNSIRLKKQILKQNKAFNEILIEFNDILVPKVINFNNNNNNNNDDDDDDKNVYMEFVPYDNVASFIADASIRELDWIWNSIQKYLNKILNSSSLIYIPLYDLYDIFEDKRNDILNNLNKGHGTSSLFSNTNEKRDFIIKIEKLLDNSLKILSIFKDLSYIKIPLGYCHGDFNFCNILGNRTDHVLYLIDFLDSFIETPLQDIASLRQDTLCLFYYFRNINDNNHNHKDNNKKEEMKIKQIMEFFDKKLINMFSTKKWWPIVNIFLFWKLARILPYSNSLEVTNNVIENMNSIHNSILCNFGESNFDIKNLEIEKVEEEEEEEKIINNKAVYYDSSFIILDKSKFKSKKNLKEKVKNQIKDKDKDKVDDKVTLIVPAAKNDDEDGKKPKWLLTMPSGSIMLAECIKGLDLTHVDKIVIGLLRSHVIKYCSNDIEALFNCFKSSSNAIFKKLSFVIIENPTIDQIETIEIIIDTASIDGAIFIKDCDNHFHFNIQNMNSVATIKITNDNQNEITFLKNKSYVTSFKKVNQYFCENENENNIIINIKEKQIISDTFCVGGYSFKSKNIFLNAVKILRNNFNNNNNNNNNDNDNNQYHTNCFCTVSDVIWQLILNGYIFFNIPIIDIKSYLDWGSHELFYQYQAKFASIFIDIDGTLVKNSGQYFKPIWGNTNALESNVKYLNKLYDSGCTYIILTTSRKESFASITKKQLKELNIKYHQIIFNLPHCKRYLINDYAPTNPYPSAIAININRNDDNLIDKLRLEF